MAPKRSVSAAADEANTVAKSTSRARLSTASTTAEEDAVNKLIKEVTAAAAEKLKNGDLGVALPPLPLSTATTRQQTPTVFTPRTPRVDDAKDGEADTAPEDGDVAPGFFSGADRVYSRRTTQCLTDFAGLILLVFLALYFTLSGYWFYVEIAKSIADGSAARLF